MTATAELKAGKLVAYLHASKKFVITRAMYNALSIKDGYNIPLCLKSDLDEAHARIAILEEALEGVMKFFGNASWEDTKGNDFDPQLAKARAALVKQS